MRKRAPEDFMGGVQGSASRVWGAALLFTALVAVFAIALRFRAVLRWRRSTAERDLRPALAAGARQEV